MFKSGGQEKIYNYCCYDKYCQAQDIDLMKTIMVFNINVAYMKLRGIPLFLDIS